MRRLLLLIILTSILTIYACSTDIDTSRVTIAQVEVNECLVNHEIVIDGTPGIWCMYTETPTLTPTSTSTLTPTLTSTYTPTLTSTPTNTLSPTATSTPAPTSTITPTATFSPTATVTVSGRGRPQIISNTLMADNGWPLRGEHFVMSNNSGGAIYDGYLFDTLLDQELWDTVRDDYHLNAIRILLSRPPQNWTPQLGNNCFPPDYRCLDFNYIMPNNETMISVLDSIVEQTAEMGMYLIIDYHPVGGHITQDAFDWWSFVAPRYANRTHVIYEAANEPVQWSAENYSAADVQFEVDIYQHIRSLAPNTHIILWSFGNSTGGMKNKVDEGVGIDYSNASVSFHPYNYSQPGTEELRVYYPILSTEIGDNYPSHTQELEALGVSWIWLDGVFNNTPGQIVSWGLDPAAVGDGIFPYTIVTSTPTSTPTPVVPTSTPIPPTPTTTPAPTVTATPEGSFTYFSTATSINGSTCINAPELNNVWNGSWSISANIYLDEAQERHPVLSKQGQFIDARGFWFGIDAGYIYLEIYTSQTSYTAITGTEIPVQQWVNISATYDFAGIATIYVNGNQVAQATGVGNINTNSADSYIGCYIWNSLYDWHFFGEIENLVITPNL